jgi:hypothetical protein
MTFLNFFYIFVGHLSPPAAGSRSTDLIETGSNPDPEHSVKLGAGSGCGSASKWNTTVWYRRVPYFARLRILFLVSKAKYLYLKANRGVNLIARKRYRSVQNLSVCSYAELLYKYDFRKDVFFSETFLGLFRVQLFPWPCSPPL